MAEEEKPAEGAEPKKSKAILFIIIGAVVAVLVLVGVVVMLFMGGDEEGDSHGGGGSAPVVAANLTPEQQALLQNEVYRNPVAIVPLEKEFIVNLKSPNPDNPREGGYAKFSATFLFSDKGAVPEVGQKEDIVRTVVTDATSAFSASELQTAQGKQKLSKSISDSVNQILTDGSVAAVVFPTFVIQP